MKLITTLQNILWNSKEARLRAGWRLLLQFVLLMFFTMIFAILDDILANSLPRSPMGESDSILLPIELLLAFTLSVWIAGRFLDRRYFYDFGFRLNASWWADLGFGLALGAGLVTCITLVEISTGWVTITGTAGRSADHASNYAGILLLLFAFILGGISEELWNRGYLLKNLAEGLNFNFFSPRGAILSAAVGTSVIFGLLHISNPGASGMSTLGLMLAGMLYAAAYVLTGELAIPIGYHITWNFFQGGVFGFPVSGYTFSVSLLTTQVRGPDLWTGGTFGAEAGLLGILSRLVGILLILVWVRLRYRKIRLREELARPQLLPLPNKADPQAP